MDDQNAPKIDHNAVVPQPPQPQLRPQLQPQQQQQQRIHRQTTTAGDRDTAAATATNVVILCLARPGQPQSQPKQLSHAIAATAKATSTATAKVTAKQWWKTKSTAFRCWPSLWSWGGIAGSRLTAIPYGTSKLRSSFVAKAISTSIPDWSKLNPTMHQNPRKIGLKINP